MGPATRHTLRRTVYREYNKDLILCYGCIDFIKLYIIKPLIFNLYIIYFQIADKNIGHKKTHRTPSTKLALQEYNNTKRALALSNFAICFMKKIIAQKGFTLTSLIY